MYLLVIDLELNFKRLKFVFISDFKQHTCQTRFYDYFFPADRFFDWTLYVFLFYNDYRIKKR